MKIGLIPLCGFLVFLITLLPVIGLVQVGGQSYADRYLYGPIIGLILAMIALFKAVYGGSGRLAHYVLITVVSVWFGWVSILGYRQVSYWSDSTRLSIASISSVGKHPTLTCLLASDLIRTGNFLAARSVLNDTMKTGIYFVQHVYNLAVVEMALGNYGAALEPIQSYLAARPDNDEVKVMLAVCYFNLEDYASMAEAIASIRARDRLSDQHLRDLDFIENNTEGTQ
ncbi:MAG: hypothetical protein BWY82_01387 [Verrucomicrobia bacterium ADurb.Bin474]|nr:MAG: hypothetical protein BWY82_01387 [Verrucomicrobia bacterium ADurb.Bin474]